MERQKSKIYTIASGCTAGHTTSVHLDLEDLALEVNTILGDEDEFMSFFRDMWNEQATEFNNNRAEYMKEIPLKGANEDVDFAEFVKRFPSETGWAWDNEHDEDRSSFKYINVTVHPWTGTRYDTIC